MGFVATISESSNRACTHVEHGYGIWSANGKCLCKELKDGLEMFAWRPRPVSLLSPEHEEQIFKELGKYSEKYAKEDERRLQLLKNKAIESRKNLRAEFKRWFDQKAELVRKREMETREKYPWLF